MTISEVTARFLVIQFSNSASNTCWGDSGGPLPFATSGGYAIGGVTSGGSSSCLKGWSDFARINNSEISSFILGLVPDAGRR